MKIVTKQHVGMIMNAIRGHGFRLVIVGGVATFLGLNVAQSDLIGTGIDMVSNAALHYLTQVTG